MGTLSLLISRCCCVVEAAQGSSVIGVFFFFLYWGIQSRTKGCGSQHSNLRIPLSPFHSVFPLLPLPSSALALSRSLRRLVDPGRPRQLEKSHSTAFPRDGSKFVLIKTKWRNLGSSAVPWKEQASGNIIWENGRRQGLGERRRSCGSNARLFLHQPDQERHSAACQAKLVESNLGTQRRSCWKWHHVWNDWEFWGGGKPPSRWSV